jgi:hypothetical protein
MWITAHEGQNEPNSMQFMRVRYQDLVSFFCVALQDTTTLLLHNNTIFVLSGELLEFIFHSHSHTERTETKHS